MLKRYFLYLVCLIAALGCAPYGFKFIYVFNLSNKIIIYALGGFFAIASVMLNAILGAYSFLNSFSFRTWQSWVVYLISLFGSIPIGLICFYGYVHSFPIGFVICLSIIVTIINSFISNSATHQLLNSMFSLSNNHNWKYRCFMIIGIMIGLIVSLIIFITTFRGISDILNTYHISNPIGLSIKLSLLSWLPLAGLYINANRAMLKKAYQLIFSQSSVGANINLVSVIFFLFALSSGSSLAQIGNEAITYLRSNHDLLTSLNLDNFSIQAVQSIFIGLCFISSSAINFIAITKITRKHQLIFHDHK